MKISSLRQTTEGGWARLSAVISCADRPDFELRFEFRDLPDGWLSSDRYDAFAVAAFPAALRRGETLEIDGPVSTLLLTALRGPISKLWTSWFPEWRPVAVHAAEAAPGTPGGAVGLFFSGGIDSFYTFLSLRSQRSPENAITHWITAHGFDVRLEEAGRFDRLTEQYRRLAGDFGLGFVVARTNLRLFSDSILTWDFYHGAALAATGLALGRGFRRFYIASATGAQKRWGSHADLDPLWSNGAVEFVHDRTGVLRLEKIRFVGAEPRALDTLRVCWEHRSVHDNCSECEKCLRTMVSLDQLGLRAAAKTFDWSKYLPGLLKVAAPVRTLHHWRSLRHGYPWSGRGAMMKALLLWLEAHSLARHGLRVLRRRTPKS